MSGTVSSGQTLIVASGQTSSGLTVLSGGTLLVYSGGTVVSAAIAGTELVTGGTDSASTVTSGGSETVTLNGQALGDTIAAGATLSLVSGASATGTVLGGSISFIIAGHLAVLSGGAEFIDSGSYDSGTVVGSGAIQTVDGQTVSAFIASGGEELLAASASATNTIGGGEVVDNGDLTYNQGSGVTISAISQLYGSGTLSELGVGTLVLAEPAYVQNPQGPPQPTRFTGTDIIYNGTLALAFGDAANSATIILTPYPSALVPGGAPYGQASSAALIVQNGTDPSASFSGAPSPAYPANVISGFATAVDTIDLAGLAYSGTTATVVTRSSVNVTEGTHSATLSIPGALPGAIIASADAQGGTLLTATPLGVGAGQTLSISAGQTGNGDIVGAGGMLDVLSGGTESGGVVLSGGALTVFNGGRALAPSVSAGGLLTVSSGGLATGNNYGLDGSLLVTPGGVVSGLTIGNAVQLTAISDVVSGGLSVSAYIAGSFPPNYPVAGPSYIGGTLVIEGVTSTVSNAVTGVMSTVVLSAGSATGTQVGDQAFLVVAAGGVTTGTILGGASSAGGFHPQYFGGGTETVSSGGMASGTFVNSGAFQIVSSGGVASGTIVSSGGQQNVSSGGTASVTVLSGGSQYVAIGGTAYGTTGPGGIEDEGTLVYAVQSGISNTFTGSLYGAGALVKSGPGALVLSGYEAGLFGNVVLSSGTLELSSATAAGTGNIDFAAVVAGVTLRIDGPAAPTNTIYGFAGGDVIDLVGLAYTGNTSATATASAVIVTEGGVSETLNIPGVAGQVLNLASDGHGGTMLSNQPIVAKTFYDYVYSGQTISGVDLLPGDAAFIEPGGTAVSTFVAGGPLVVFGGAASGSVLQPGGNEFLQIGTDTGATVGSGAILWVSGGVDTGARVFGLEAVYGGVASASTVLSGGDITVAGAVAAGAVVSSGGVVAVSGGTASGATVSSGGNLFLIAGSDVGATVNAGGLVTVSGGVDSGATVLQGGEVAAVAHGVVRGATVQSGGTLLLLTGGSQSGATLLSGGQLDLGFLSYASGGSASYNSATHVLSVTERGTTVTETLSGDYTGLRFVDSADPNGGTLVKAVAVLPPAITVSNGQTVGSSTGITVLRGLETVLSGGVALLTDVEAYGTLVVAGGAAYASYVNTSGTAILLSGTTGQTSIESGAVFQVSGGIDSGTVLDQGGMEFVTGNGVALNADILGGASLVLQAGGTQSGATLSPGGSLDLKDFAFANVSAFAFNNATNTATFTAAGVVHSAAVSTGYYPGLTISAFADNGGGLLLKGVL